MQLTSPQLYFADEHLHVSHSPLLFALASPDFYSVLRSNGDARLHPP